MRSKVISLSASGLSLCVYLKRRLHAGRVKGQHSLYLESRVRPSVHAFSTTVVTQQLRNARRALRSAAQRSTECSYSRITPPPSSLLALPPPLLCFPSLSPFHPSLCCTCPPPNLNAGSDLVPALTHSLTPSLTCHAFLLSLVTRTVVTSCLDTKRETISALRRRLDRRCPMRFAVQSTGWLVSIIYILYMRD